METWIIWKKGVLNVAQRITSSLPWISDTSEFQQKELHYGFSLAFCLLFPLKNWSDIGLILWTQCLYWSNISRIGSILDICHVAEIQRNKFEFRIVPFKREVSLFPHWRQKVLKASSIQLSILLSSPSVQVKRKCYNPAVVRWSVNCQLPWNNLCYWIGRLKMYKAIGSLVVGIPVISRVSSSLFPPHFPPSCPPFHQVDQRFFVF